MPFNERCEILEGFEATGETTNVDDRDGTVCDAIRRIKPTYFANGGDRKTNNTPEMDVCNEVGVELLWNMGGGKIQSSSSLVVDAGIEPKSTDDEIQPTRVEILQGGDIPKNAGEY